MRDMDPHDRCYPLLHGPIRLKVIVSTKVPPRPTTSHISMIFTTVLINITVINVNLVITIAFKIIIISKFSIVIIIKY